MTTQTPSFGPLVAGLLARAIGVALAGPLVLAAIAWLS
jgi:hypothetical protein